jgi:hypothetical protein
MSSDSSLGAYLRRRRERSGLSVEAVPAGSRIVPRLLDALETDRDLLPAPVYARGGTMNTSRSAAPASAAPAPVERVLRMRATDTTWVRVQPGGAQPTEETLPPGTAREWRSAGRLHITVGNAGGVELALDGRALPALGAPGQVGRDPTVPGEARP